MASQLENGLVCVKHCSGVYHYKLLYTISINIEIYKGPVQQTKKIPHCAVKFKASEENRIVCESLILSTEQNSIVD